MPFARPPVCRRAILVFESASTRCQAGAVFFKVESPAMKPAYTFRPNTLYFGDCLEVMNAFVEAGQQVDLIYLDPPFNSDANYSMLFKRDTHN